MLGDFFITPNDILEQLLELPKMTREEAIGLLDPQDKQNVPKAVTLLQSLLQLKDLSASLSPTTEHHRQAIIFLTEVLGWFLLPFILVDMSLSEQVEHLAAFGFGAAYLWIKHGGACLTGALYTDTQSVIKNIIFTIARMQVIDPELKLFILHEGTDRLEGLFSDCRTQDHAQNFDIEQLAGKLSVATLINVEWNPDLNQGHRCLDLRGAMGIDHVNPKSWIGNTFVGNVDLEISWKRGQKKAEDHMHEFFNDSISFDHLFSKPDCDLLRPLSGKYVGVSPTPEDV